MIRSAVTVSLVEEARGGPFVYWMDLADACKKAQQFGFDAVEVFPPSATAVDPARLRMLLNDHGLAAPAAVGTGAGWVKSKLTLTQPDVAEARKGREFIREIIDFAGRVPGLAIIQEVDAGAERRGRRAPDRAGWSYLAGCTSKTSASTPSNTASR